MIDNTSFIDLLPELLFGREGDEDDQQNSSNESGDDKSGESGSAGGASEGSQERNSGDIDDRKELKGALANERAERKKLEKELAKRTKADEEAELANKTEVEQARIKQEKAEEKAAKLASGLLNRDLNSAIRAAARAIGFIDVDDAIAGVERSKLSYEQDDEDPSNISVDEKSIEKAVKDLATKKPHFIRQGTDDGEPTGSPMGGSRGKGSKTSQDYKQLYSSL